MNRRFLPLFVLFAAVLCGGLWFALRSTGQDAGASAQSTALSPHARRGPTSVLPGSSGPEATASQGADAGSTRSGIELDPVALATAVQAEEEEEPTVVLGRLLDGRGDAIEGARVDLRKGEAWINLPADLEPVSGVWGMDRARRTTTDGEGRFAFEEVEPGEYNLALRAAGFAPLDRPRNRIPVHERFDLGDYELSTGIVVEGQLVDEHGAGVTGVLVLRATSPDSGSLRLSVPGFGAPTAESGVDGEFRVDTLPPGGWHLIFDSPAHRLVELRGTTEPAGELSGGHTVRLEAGVSITGRVEGVEAGERALRVVAKATVKQPSSAGDSAGSVERDRPRPVDVRADGSFELQGLAPGLQYRLRLEREREPDLEAPSDQVSDRRWKTLDEVESVVAMAGARDVLLERVPVASVTYRMIGDESGAAVSRAFVSIRGEDLRGGGLLEDDADEPLTEHPDGRVVHAELRPPPAGTTVRVKINAGGHAPYEGPEFLLTPGEERDLGEIELERAPGVSVLVVDEESQAPIAGARVLIASATKSDWIARYLDPDTENEPRTDARVRMALTDAEGRARITAFPNEVCVLRAVEGAYMPCEELRSIPPHDTELTLELQPAGSVVVRVLDPRSRPLSGVYVQHTDADGNRQGRNRWDTEARARQTSDEAGEVHFARLSPGRHKFSAVDGDDPFGGGGRRPRGSTPEDPEGTEEVPVVSGSRSEVELHLAERGGLKALLLEGGFPLVGALTRLTAIEEEENQRNFWRGPGVTDKMSAISDHEGRIEFDGLPADRYMLMVSHPSRRMVFGAEVLLVPDPLEERIELGMASIEGRVTGESGEGLEGLRITVMSTGDSRQFRMMDYQVVVREEEDGDADFEMEQVGRSTAETDVDGRFVLRGVRPDIRLTVAVDGDYITRATVQVPPLSRDEIRGGVDLGVRAAGRLQIELAGIGPNGRDRYRVSLKTEGDGPETRTASIRGWRPKTTLSSLSPGTWKIEVRRGKDVVATGEATVVENTTSAVILRL